MFEKSLLESARPFATPQTRWTAAMSIVLQGALAALMVMIPLLHTESLPRLGVAPKIILPIATPPPPPPTILQKASGQMVSAISVPGRALAAPRIMPSRIDSTPQPDASVASFQGMNIGAEANPLLGTTGAFKSDVAISVAPAKKTGPVRVSGGVSAGQLLAPIRPNYPPIAKAAHVSGTVVVEAIISKTGMIESCHVVKGPAMLQAAAIEAIQAARYRPFQLNGEPTEVQTTITVNFLLGG